MIELTMKLMPAEPDNIQHFHNTFINLTQDSNLEIEVSDP